MEISTVCTCQDTGFECELEGRVWCNTMDTCLDSGCSVLIPHVKTTLKVLNIVDVASEMHIAIQILIVRRWDRRKTMPGICDKCEIFRQCLMC